MSAKIQPILPQTTSSPKIRPASDGPQSAIKWSLIFIVIGYLWLRLINNLRVEWSTNPQYGYGWVVPFLCLGLLARRWQAAKETKVQKPAITSEGAKSHWLWAVWLFAAFAFLYLPTRLIEAATPEWRPVQWALGIEAIGLTLCAIRIGGGRYWLRQLAFPVCFFLVAIPWPTLLETPLIQHLAQFNASVVVEVLGLLGQPAIQHGNVIEVGTGMVGIDDACSGIRSLQSSLMISFFLGEYLWLKRSRRILLVPIGLVLAILFNVCRTSVLTWIAAKNGTAAIAHYHDEAGMTILLACMATMWGIAFLLKSKPKSPGLPSNPPKAQFANDTSFTSEELASASGPRIEASGYRSSSNNAFIFRLALSLLIWLVVVEGGVQLWYKVRESRSQPGSGWSVIFPSDNPTFKELAMAPVTRELLQFDQGKQGQWRDEDGILCQVFYFNWVPGRVAGYLAKRHTPEICLTAVGETLRSGPELTFVKVQGVELPIRSYEFESSMGPLYVYQCRWEAGAGREAYVDQESARYNLVRAVWAGRGIHGQKVLEVILSGNNNAESAKQTLMRQLDKIIRAEPLPADLK